MSLSPGPISIDWVLSPPSCEDTPRSNRGIECRACDPTYITAGVKLHCTEAGGVSPFELKKALLLLQSDLHSVYMELLFYIMHNAWLVNNALIITWSA